MALGYEVEGLDASQDMLDRCQAKAVDRGIDVTLHHGEMQSFSLAARYRSIYLAGASFTLLTTEADAANTLERIYAHLKPGGSALIPLEIKDPEAERRFVGRFRETITDGGDRLRVGLVRPDVSADGHCLCRGLRYERIPADGEPEALERDFRTRWWSQNQFKAMLVAAGFGRVTLLAPEGGHAQPDAAVFVALGERGSD